MKEAKRSNYPVRAQHSSICAVDCTVPTSQTAAHYFIIQTARCDITGVLLSDHWGSTALFSQRNPVIPTTRANRKL